MLSTRCFELEPYDQLIGIQLKKLRLNSLKILETRFDLVGKTLKLSGGIVSAIIYATLRARGKTVSL